MDHFNMIMIFLAYGLELTVIVLTAIFVPPVGLGKSVVIVGATLAAILTRVMDNFS